MRIKLIIQKLMKDKCLPIEKLCTRSYTIIFTFNSMNKLLTKWEGNYE